MKSDGMKRWLSEDNLWWKSQSTRDADEEKIDFWTLLYPEHPMIKLRPIVDSSPEDNVYCVGCGCTHNSYNITEACYATS